MGLQSNGGLRREEVLQVILNAAHRDVGFFAFPFIPDRKPATGPGPKWSTNRSLFQNVWREPGPRIQLR
jgi:hypothetical protein